VRVEHAAAQVVAPTWMPTHRLVEAVDDACTLHGRQARKHARIPTVAHLFGVCSLVMGAGGDEDVAIAALLHDAVEDAGGDATQRRIERRFGRRVATIVAECTEPHTDPQPPWVVRKEAYLAHLLEASPDALLVALADKFANARDMLTSLRDVGEDAWRPFRDDRSSQVWWYRSLREAFSTRRDAFGPLALLLLDDFSKLVEALALRLLETPD